MLLYFPVFICVAGRLKCKMLLWSFGSKPLLTYRVTSMQQLDVPKWCNRSAVWLGTRPKKPLSAKQKALNDIRFLLEEIPLHIPWGRNPSKPETTNPHQKWNPQDRSMLYAGRLWHSKASSLSNLVQYTKHWTTSHFNTCNDCDKTKIPSHLHWTCKWLPFADPQCPIPRASFFFFTYPQWSF